MAKTPFIEDAAQEARRLEIRLLAQEEVEKFNQGFEQRLTTAITKALDTVVEEYNARLTSLEEDQARILRHLGLEN